MRALTLTDFLLARIAEDEESARACGDASWRYDDGQETALFDQRRTGSPYPTVVHAHVWGPEVSIQSSAEFHWPSMQRIARHDPARVLAECAAKRRIVEMGTPYTVAWLGTVYADHPDYREEWKP